MYIHFEMVRGADELRELLTAQGWRLDRGGPMHFTASHPSVRNQPAARARLLQIGLLTSNRLRIEFGPDSN
jgi:hypothetical protein